MTDPIAYLCEIEDPIRIRSEAPGLGVQIIWESTRRFLQGPPEVQFEIAFQGARGFLVPSGIEARARQRAAGRFLSPYSWVTR